MCLVVYMGEKRDTCRVSVRKFEGKEPLRRPRHKWEDAESIGMKGVDWVNLPQDGDKWRCLAKTVMKRGVRHSAGKFFTGQTSVG